MNFEPITRDGREVRSVHPRGGSARGFHVYDGEIVEPDGSVTPASWAHDGRADSAGESGADLIPSGGQQEPPQAGAEGGQQEPPRAGAEGGQQEPPQAGAEGGQQEPPQAPAPKGKRAKA